jgi:hypothetical protein
LTHWQIIAVYVGALLVAGVLTYVLSGLVIRLRNRVARYFVPATQQRAKDLKPIEIRRAPKQTVRFRPGGPRISKKKVISDLAATNVFADPQAEGMKAARRDELRQAQLAAEELERDEALEELRNIDEVITGIGPLLDIGKHDIVMSQLHDASIALQSLEPLENRGLLPKGSTQERRSQIVQWRTFVQMNRRQYNSFLDKARTALKNGDTTSAFAAIESIEGKAVDELRDQIDAVRQAAVRERFVQLNQERERLLNVLTNRLNGEIHQLRLDVSNGRRSLTDLNERLETLRAYALEKDRRSRFDTALRANDFETATVLAEEIGDAELSQHLINYRQDYETEQRFDQMEFLSTTLMQHLNSGEWKKAKLAAVDLARLAHQADHSFLINAYVGLANADLQLGLKIPEGKEGRLERFNQAQVAMDKARETALLPGVRPSDTFGALLDRAIFLRMSERYDQARLQLQEIRDWLREPTSDISGPELANWHSELETERMRLADVFEVERLAMALDQYNAGHWQAVLPLLAGWDSPEASSLRSMTVLRLNLLEISSSAERLKPVLTALHAELEGRFPTWNVELGRAKTLGTYKWLQALAQTLYQHENDVLTAVKSDFIFRGRLAELLVMMTQLMDENAPKLQNAQAEIAGNAAKTLRHIAQRITGEAPGSAAADNASRSPTIQTHWVTVIFSGLIAWRMLRSVWPLTDYATTDFGGSVMAEMIAPWLLGIIFLGLSAFVLGHVFARVLARLLRPYAYLDHTGRNPFDGMALGERKEIDGRIYEINTTPAGAVLYTSFPIEHKDGDPMTLLYPGMMHLELVHAAAAHLNHVAGKSADAYWRPGGLAWELLRMNPRLGVSVLSSVDAANWGAQLSMPLSGYVKRALSARQNLRQRYPNNPLIIIGNSLGGVIAFADIVMNKVTRDEVAGVVLMNPAFRLAGRALRAISWQRHVVRETSRTFFTSVLSAAGSWRQSLSELVNPPPFAFISVRPLGAEGQLLPNDDVVDIEGATGRLTGPDGALSLQFREVRHEHTSTNLGIQPLLNQLIVTMAEGRSLQELEIYRDGVLVGSGRDFTPSTPLEGLLTANTLRLQSPVVVSEPEPAPAFAPVIDQSDWATRLVTNFGDFAGRLVSRIQMILRRPSNPREPDINTPQLPWPALVIATSLSPTHVAPLALAAAAAYLLYRKTGSLRRSRSARLTRQAA